MTDIISSDWTELDADNTNPSPNGVSGGYSPSTIAPTIRTIRGAIKRDFVTSKPVYTSTGTGAAYVLTYQQAPAAYTKGLPYSFWAHINNTGACTLNVNGLGAKSILMPDGSALTVNQIKANRVVDVVYNGTSFVLTSVVDQNLKLGDVSANTLTLTAALPIASGGTGANTASSARNSLGLAAIANTASASDLTTGTIPDARISGAYSGITLLTVNDIIANGGGTGNPDIELHRLGVKVGSLYHDASNLVLRKYNITTGAAEGYLRIDGNGANDINFNGNIIWHAANDGAGSTLDADLLDGQHGSFYQDASNLNAGTIPNARISGAYSGITTLDTTGRMTVTQAGEALRIAGALSTDDPYITFYAGGARTAYIQHTDGTADGNGFRMFNDVTDDYLYLSNVNNTAALKFYDSSVGVHNTVLTSGNYTSTLNATYVNRSGDSLTGGFTVTSDSDGTKSSGTYTPVVSEGNFKHITNGGAFTLAAPTGVYSMVIQITNSSTAGAITMSGFTKVTGSAFTTTSGHDFFVYITRGANFVHAQVQALQ